MEKHTEGNECRKDHGETFVMVPNEAMPKRIGWRLGRLFSGQAAAPENTMATTKSTAAMSEVKKALSWNWEALVIGSGRLDRRG